MESQAQRGVSTRPVAPYIGGKRNLAGRVIAQIDKTPHDLFADVFVGMAGIFLRRTKPAKVEVINDISSDVATLFRILQRHYVPFIEMLRWQLTTRADFDRLMVTNPDALTDLERAARFLYLQRLAYGGMVRRRTFGVANTTPARFDLTKLVPMLEEVHERLTRVVIERLPFGDFITRYDRRGALFYLDPPYLGSETDYGLGVFKREDFERLAAGLAHLEGRFILSLNDRPEVRRIFRAFSIRSVKTTYTLASKGAKSVREVIITGP